MVTSLLASSWRQQPSQFSPSLPVPLCHRSADCWWPSAALEEEWPRLREFWHVAQYHQLQGAAEQLLLLLYLQACSGSASQPCGDTFASPCNCPFATGCVLVQVDTPQKMKRILDGVGAALDAQDKLQQ